MEEGYKHISIEERDRIAEMKSLGDTGTDIAIALGRSKSTLSRELRRNATPAYKVHLSHRAHERAVTREQEAGSRPRLKRDEVVSYVRNKLEQGLSPELIAGRIGLEHSDLSISHEAIYHPKTEGRAELIGHLVRGHRKRKSKGIGRKERKTKIPNRIPIEARPQSVETRHRFGHWEGDSLVSRKSFAAVNSLVERKSRFLLLTRLKRKSAGLTKDAVILRLQGFPEKARRTLTLDNGTENAQHEAITEAIGMQCYFARPYASWQRGTNESVNGLVRRYFPKGTDFSKITDKQVAKVESLINNRPRKCLGYKTPLEVASAFVALRP